LIVLAGIPLFDINSAVFGSSMLSVTILPAETVLLVLSFNVNLMLETVSRPSVDKKDGEIDWGSGIDATS
jgi:hypothetical protein